MKFPLLRTHSYMYKMLRHRRNEMLVSDVPSSLPAMDHHVALHASRAAGNSVLLISALHFNFIFP